MLASFCERADWNRAGKPAVVADANHAADLIRKKLIKDNISPDKILQFSHLYSRLLADQILSEKWATLYFLYQLADTQPAASSRQAQSQYSGASFPVDGQAEQSPGQRQREFPINSPAFNEAFSHAGLLRLPTGEESERTKVDSTRPRKEQPSPSLADGTSVRSGRDGESHEKAYISLSSAEPSEQALLRDLPFVLQGLSSKHLIFKSSKSLQLPSTLPVPLISLLHSLAEPCLLYKSLSEFVESEGGGLVGQSFRAALGMELRSYLKLVATLEGQIRRALAQVENEPKTGIGKAGVTLKRCVYWTREATMGLRLMSLMVEESKGKKGGQIISVIHGFALSHGDPFVVTFAERLLSRVTRPFYDMLRQWIYDGELLDPYLEFFVAEQQDIDSNDQRGPPSVWEDKYRLLSAAVPSIVTEQFAHKVFLIGKSLNFIRHDCHDGAWVEHYSKNASRELRYGDTATLEASIDEAYKTTMARLTHLMESRFDLFEHLSALKQYLLLSAGDFISVLLESLSSALDRPANTQYRHTLTAQLEHAVRNSNAQFSPPDVLRRLDSRMLQLSHGEIGWDVFTLEYKISPPVDVVITPWCSEQYLKIFNFLWRVKRVEFCLNQVWRKVATGARSILGAVDDKFGSDWKAARCVMSEMIHFVNQLQYYILFEVIEASWNELQREIRKEGSTLDDLIKAHHKYLTNITTKGLLSSGESTGSVATANFPGQLHELLKTMLAYRDVVDQLYASSVAEYTRRQDRSSRIETRTKDGKWGVSERDSTNEGGGGEPPLMPGVDGNLSEESILATQRARLRELAERFKRRVTALLGDLMAQQDAGMRWLAMVMNFNDVYQPVRRRRHGHGTSTHKGSGSVNASVLGTVRREGSQREMGNVTVRDREREKVKMVGGKGKERAVG
jgi:gamma-tubulin complex component 3